jgi:hypothetical protein
MASATLETALQMGRGFLNDTAATVWSDANLIPFMQQAHYELQTDLWLVGSPVIRAVTSPLLIPDGANPTVPTLPSNFLIPTLIQECGQSGGSPDNLFIPMTECFFFPIPYTLTTVLAYWSWQQETLLFAGSSLPRYVVIQYRRLIPIPQLSTDLIGMTFGELYLGARGAAIAAGAVGNTAAAGVLDGIATANFNKVVMANRGQQKPITKP